MSKKNRRKRLFYIMVMLLATVAIILLSLDITNVIHFHHKHVPVTASSYTKGEPQTPSRPSTTNNSNITNLNTSNNTQQISQGNNPGGSMATVDLLPPTGDFVSNHHPNLSGSPAPNTMTSVCDTTPGASCSIFFTLNGTTKSLPTETVDSGGSAYWGWTLQSIGLTTGSWVIHATVSLEGQTKTATDAMTLTILP
jgi:hypothetical protein